MKVSLHCTGYFHQDMRNRWQMSSARHNDEARLEALWRLRVAQNEARRRPRVEPEADWIPEFLQEAV